MELINREVQCSKNWFKSFLQEEAGAFGNNIGKELQKSCPKLKNIYIIHLRRIFTYNPMQAVAFCKKYINYVQQQFRFSHFEGSIIP